MQRIPPKPEFGDMTLEQLNDIAGGNLWINTDKAEGSLRWWVSSNAATPEAFALVGEIERIIRLYLAELERLPDSGKREGPQLGDPIPAVEAMAYTLVENSPDLLEALGVRSAVIEATKH